MDIEELVARVRRVRRAGAPADPELLAEVAAVAGAESPSARLVDVGRLLDGVPVSRLAPPGQRLRPLRVAVTGTFTAADVAPLLRAHLLAAGVEPVLHVAGFDQMLTELTDPGSELARFAPDVTLCLLHDRAFLPDGWDPTALAALRSVLAGRAQALGAAAAGFATRAGSTVVLHTVPLSTVELRTVVGYRDRAALGRLWRELNTGLLELAEAGTGVHVLDLETLLTDHPAAGRDERLYAFAGMAWTPSVEALYAREAAAFCRATVGLAKKLLVLDLDNTLWGGVLGDDGPAGIAVGGQYPGRCYTELQRRAAALRRQGVLLAVCSKNEQSTVDDVFSRHPELVLRSGDFVAQAVNWGRKDHNIRQLVETLNLGLDSVVFVDDSAFECDLVRRSLPQVSVVHLDGDPSGNAARLVAAGYFDVLETTATDTARTELYRARAQRHDFAASFASAEEYLRGLALRVDVRPVDEFTAPRLEQLALRTNQFTMTGRPCPVTGDDPDRLVLAFDVADRFGCEGVVGGVWLDRRPDHWHIANVVMSCRVFSRGVEHAVLQHVADLAAAAGAERLVADFRPTGRNGPAGAFYPQVGFVVASRDGEVVRYGLPLAPRPRVMPSWITLNDTQPVPTEPVPTEPVPIQPAPIQPAPTGKESVHV